MKNNRSHTTHRRGEESLRHRWKRKADAVDGRGQRLRLLSGLLFHRQHRLSSSIDDACLPLLFSTLHDFYCSAFDVPELPRFKSTSEGNSYKLKSEVMDVDSQPTMEETVLVGDDLMLGPPSPIIPQEIASHVLEGVDLCDGILRNFYLCLQVNDIEPFCQDEIVLYRQCAEGRDKILRQRLQDSECKLGLSMPIEAAKERASQLQSDVTTLERRLILASGIEGVEGFRQRWSLHGRLEDTKKRLDSLNQGISKRNKEEESHNEPTAKKKWFLW